MAPSSSLLPPFGVVEVAAVLAPSPLPCANLSANVVIGGGGGGNAARPVSLATERPRRVVWLVRRNVAAWTRAVQAAFPQWAQVPPACAGKRGFFVRGEDGAAVPFMPETGVHNKLACFHWLLKEAPQHLRERARRFLPETYVSFEEFEARPTSDDDDDDERVKQDDDATKGAAPEARGVDDVFFFKAARDDNGHGVVAFRGGGANVAALLRRHRKKRGKDKRAGRCGDDLPVGIFQRFIPRLMLWPGNPPRKFDLRVYVAGLCQNGCVQAYVYRDAAVRVSRDAFDASQLTSTSMMTHRSGLFPTSGPYASSQWQAWEDKVLPRVVEACGALVDALSPKLARHAEGGLFLWGFDLAVDARHRPYLLEINTSPQLLYPRRSCAAWVGVIHDMLRDLLTYLVAPRLFHVNEGPIQEAFKDKDKGNNSKLGRWIACDHNYSSV